MRGDRGAILAALAALLAACPSPDTPATYPSADALTAKVREAYAGWTTEDTSSPDCSAYFTACAEAFQRRVGLDPRDPAAPNPRAIMENPDPRWIVGWERLSAEPEKRHETFAALTYAAALRAHFDACAARHAEQDAARAAATDFVSSEIGKLATVTNPYGKLSGLMRIRGELRRMHPSPIGPRYALEIAIHEAFARTGRALVYDLQNQRAEDASLLRPALSFEDERDIVCAEGLPAWQDADILPAGAVQIAFGDARLAELEEKVAGVRDLEKRIPDAEARVPALDVDAAPDPSTLVTVQRALAGVTLSVARIDDKAPDGGVTATLSGKEATARVRLIVRFPESPELPMMPGDEIVFIGRATKLEKKTAGKITEVTAEMDGVHVLEIWRQNLLAADYFVQ